MTLSYVQHEKISLKNSAHFNEAWLHDRISDNPGILGLGDITVLDHERAYTNAGRLDLLFWDEDNNRRYEVEVMLGATDPSHIIRAIEYWDIERRRYPAYEHVAILIAEDITARFLNVISLLSGSIPLIAIQLDALKVGDNILLNFVQVLDQTELRVDDTTDDSGGGQADRSYWDQKAGPSLMKLCDETLAMINTHATHPQEFNYLRGYIGLQSNGLVKNFVSLAPKRTKNFVHIWIRNANAFAWKDRFEEAGVPVRSHGKRRFRVTMSPKDFEHHKDNLDEVLLETAREFQI